MTHHARAGALVTKALSAYIVPERGSDFTAEIANLTPTTLFIKTTRSFRFNDSVAVTFPSVAVDGKVVFVSEAPPGAIVVFDPAPDVRRLIEERINEIEVLESDPNGWEEDETVEEEEPVPIPKPLRINHDAMSQRLAASATSEGPVPEVPTTAPLGNPPLEQDDSMELDGLMPAPASAPGLLYEDFPGSGQQPALEAILADEVVEESSNELDVEQPIQFEPPPVPTEPVPTYSRDPRQRLRQLTVPGRPASARPVSNPKQRALSDPGATTTRRSTSVEAATNPIPRRGPALRPRPRLRPGEPITDHDPSPANNDAAMPLRNGATSPKDLDAATVEMEKVVVEED